MAFLINKGGDIKKEEIVINSSKENNKLSFRNEMIETERMDPSNQNAF